MDCWSCGAERRDAPFCGTCHKVQPVSARVDHYARLGLPRRARVERDELDRAFREISTKVHPDRFGQESPVERRLALEQTAAVNDAYRTLKDPQGRAEYLLSLEGASVGAEPDPALLMEMLELQEAITESDDEAFLEGALADAEQRLEARLDEVAAYFDDEAGAQAEVMEKLGELRYLRRLIERIELRLEEAV